MAIKKTLMIAGAVTTIGLAGSAAAVQAVSAQSNDSLAQAIAQKFNLKQDDVQSVIDQQRQQNQAEHQAERKKHVEDKLTQAVSDGKITQEQKTKILAKLEELQSQHQQMRQEFKNMTPEQRKQTMQQHHDELKQWAQDNGIPTTIFSLIGPGGHGLRHGHMGQGQNTDQSNQ